MNIAEAKEQIKRSVKIYLTKNEDGAYKIPVEKQRPIFLYGAPGIGKTAIMEQISEELDIPLVDRPYFYNYNTPLSCPLSAAWSVASLLLG